MCGMAFVFHCSDREKAVTESLLGGTLEVRTRSGLHPAEAALIAQLPGLLPRVPKNGKIIVCQTRTGATAAALRMLAPEAALTLHTYDAHHAQNLGRNLRAGTPLLPPPAVVCSAWLPEETFDAAFLLVTGRALSNEMTRDLLQNLRQRLAPGAPLFAAFDTPLETARGFIAASFGKPSVKLLSPKGDPVHLASVLCPAGALKREKDFSAAFSASLPGVPAFALTTWPGVFAHRRPDEGGLALAETAAALLKPGERLLDIGCGCGMVGIALALASPAPSHVTFLDAHARAVFAAAHNARVNRLPSFDTVLDTAARFTPAKRGHTLALANPPYFSDYKIAGDFIELARRSLVPGGRLLIVTQQTEFYDETLPPLFKRVETLRRRGYALFLATQP